MSAEWSFEPRIDWQPYLEQTGASLRKVGYEPVATATDALAFARHVPGDVYRVQVASDANAPRTRVIVRFLASPD